MSSHSRLRIASSANPNVDAIELNIGGDDVLFLNADEENNQTNNVNETSACDDESKRPTRNDHSFKEEEHNISLLAAAGDEKDFAHSAVQLSIYVSVDDLNATNTLEKDSVDENHSEPTRLQSNPHENDPVEQTLESARPPPELSQEYENTATGPESGINSSFISFNSSSILNGSGAATSAEFHSSKAAIDVQSADDKSDQLEETENALQENLLSNNGEQILPEQNEDLLKQTESNVSPNTLAHQLKSQPQHPLIEESILSDMKCLFKNTRYFLIKSNNYENVNLAKLKVLFCKKKKLN
jgi:hypothetical protein